MTRWHIAISSHGLGHLAQTAPVLQRLIDLDASALLTIQSTLPEATLRQWLPFPFSYLGEPTDLGIPMKNALDVDVEQCHRHYSEQFRNWGSLVASQASMMRDADAVLTNNSYLVGAAAAELGLPCWHACSLNWADLYQHYCGNQSGADLIHGQLVDAYNKAQAFFQPEPSMPMPAIRNAIPVGTCVRLHEPVDLQAALGLPLGQKVLLVSLGGMPYSLDVSAWADLPGWTVLAHEAADRFPFQIPLGRLPFAHGSILAGCDAVVTKPGYGTFVEIAAHSLAAITVSRGDWPEEPALMNWLRRHAPVGQIDRHQLHQGDVGNLLYSLVHDAGHTIKPDLSGPDSIVRSVLKSIAPATNV